MPAPRNRLAAALRAAHAVADDKDKSKATDLHALWLRACNTLDSIATEMDPLDTRAAAAMRVFSERMEARGVEAVNTMRHVLEQMKRDRRAERREAP